MADYTPRAPWKFTNSDGSRTYTFPVDGLQWEPTQAFRRALAGVIGADYGHDYAQGAPWSKDFGEQAVRFELWGDDPNPDTFVDAAFDTMVGELVGIGAGKLWARDAAGDARWTWAKLDGLPQKTVDAETLFKLPVAVRFVQESDWFAEDPVVVTEAGVTASPHEFVLTNSGNAPCQAIEIRLRSNGAGGFEETVMLNVSNGYQWETLRTAVDADSEVKVDAEDSAALWSANNGATYVDDFANFSYGDAQVPFMVFEAGDNLLRFTDAAGAPRDYDIEITFWPTFHSA